MIPLIVQLGLRLYNWKVYFFKYVLNNKIRDVAFEVDN